MNKKTRKIVLALVLLILIVSYFSFCTLLYFFEPVNYNAPDLSLSDFSFNMYNKFSYELNDKFYIKQISYSDIVSAPDEERLKYVDDTIIIIGEQDISYSDMTTLVDSVGGKICGYIEIIDFYQISFNNKSYEELANICAILSDNNMVKIAIIDYFEETPVSDTSTEMFSDSVYDYYYHDMIDSYKAWNLSENFITDITVGMIDTPVYYIHDDINVVNHSDYSCDMLDNESILTSPSHGTHVAGIISASSAGEAPGICQNANIYSENGINNSISYWIAAMVNMIVNNNIKVLNISMGYNSYIPVSASLGCEFSLQYIENENELFEAVLNNILQSGYEFLICISAGNETGTSLYKTNSMFFSYGEKEKLRKYDIFGVFSSEPEYCDSKYQFSMTSIDDTNVRDRIMIVGSCDNSKRYSDFASAGEGVDIVAPGEYIYSTGYYDKYEHMSGTSMAAPFVSGSAALLFAIDDSLTGAQVKDILIQTATETVSEYGYDYPLLNIGNAVEYVLNKQNIA